MTQFFKIAIMCVFCLSAGSFSASAQQNQPAPWDQWTTKLPTWVEPIEPFRVIGNIYYVGTKGLSSFLITSDEGHVLIDGGLPQNAPLIAHSIQTLGFDIKDVKTILNSHAHFDHSGGLKELKEMSGAEFLASEGDRSALEGGFYLGFEDNIDVTAPPVSVDRIIREGDTITVGDITLTTLLTPGHTRGCTSFRMTAYEQGTPYDVLFFGGASVAANKLSPEQYEGIVEDYKNTFDKTKSWQPDVLLVNHPFYFDMDTKREKLIAGNPLAFVDKGAFPALRQDLKHAFEKSLAEPRPSEDKH
jgi:metallo-beta-lactamase class B